MFLEIFTKGSGKMSKSMDKALLRMLMGKCILENGLMERNKERDLR